MYQIRGQSNFWRFEFSVVPGKIWIWSSYWWWQESPQPNWCSFIKATWNYIHISENRIIILPFMVWYTSFLGCTNMLQCVIARKSQILQYRHCLIFMVKDRVSQVNYLQEGMWSDLLYSLSNCMYPVTHWVRYAYILYQLEFDTLYTYHCSVYCSLKWWTKKN